MRWWSLLHTWLPASIRQWNGRKNRSYSWGLLKARPAGLLKSWIPWLADCGNSNDLAWMTVPLRASPNLSPSFSKLSMFWSLEALSAWSTFHYEPDKESRATYWIGGTLGSWMKELSGSISSSQSTKYLFLLFYLGFDRWTFYSASPKTSFDNPPFPLHLPESYSLSLVLPLVFYSAKRDSI